MKAALALAFALVTSAHADPARLAAKLAKERVTGNAIVDRRLYATEVNARAATGEKTGTLIAVRVLEDRGDVLRVSTEIPRASDCGSACRVRSDGVRAPRGSRAPTDARGFEAVDGWHGDRHQVESAICHPSADMKIK